jgi:hypothetical protein
MDHTPLDRLHTERQMLLIQYQNLNKLIPPYRDPVHDEMLESVRNQKQEILNKIQEIDDQILVIEDAVYGHNPSTGVNHPAFTLEPYKISDEILNSFTVPVEELKAIRSKVNAELRERFENKGK